MSDTTVSADTGEMELAAAAIRKAVVDTDLKQSLPTVDVGHFPSSTYLWALASVVGAFPASATAQLGAIANAITLGADDVTTADTVGGR